jgi:hypothetical protein
MTPHPDSGQLARYLARTLPPAEILALHGHLEACRECRRALEEASLAHLTSVNMPLLWEAGDVHLTEAEMVAFVANLLPEASQHLAACESCQDSVAAMQSVRNEPVRGRKVVWLPVAGAIAAALLLAAALVHYWPARQPPAPAILASIQDSGRTIELDANGVLRGLDSASPEERDLVRDALKQRSLPAGPTLPAEAPGVLLSPGTQIPTTLAPLEPLNTRVLSDRPVFKWRPWSGAENYQVLVAGENLDPIARSGRITATEWQPETPLPRGVVLLWQVRAWHGAEMVSAPAPPAPPVRFEIAAAAVAARLEQLRAAPQSSHLLAAVLCAHEGLHEEAAKEIQILAQENPGSNLAQALLK